MKRIILFFVLFFAMVMPVLAQPMAPPTPTCIQINTDFTANIFWTPASLNGNVFNYYEVFMSSSAAGPFVSVGQIPNALGTNLSNFPIPAHNAPLHFYLTSNFNAPNTVSVNSDTIQSIFLNLNQVAGSPFVTLTWNNIHVPPLATSQPNYRIYRKIPSQNPNFIQITNNQPVETYDDVIHHPLCQDSIYYRIELGDLTGCVSVSIVRGDLFVNPVPATPELVAVSVSGTYPSNTVNLAWLPSTSPDVKGYYIYELNNLNSPVQIADIQGINNTFYAYTPARPDTGSICYRIAAYDSCNNTSDPGQWHCTMHLQTVMDNCTGICEISWDSYRTWNSGISNYEVYVSQNLSPPALLATVPSTDTTYKHFPLIQGTHYEYYVRAIDGTGNIFSDSNIDTILADVPIRPAFLYIKYATVIDNRTVEVCFLHDSVADISKYVILRSDNLGDTFDTLRNMVVNGVGMPDSIPFDPDVSIITFLDTSNCLTYRKSYVYKIIAIDSCNAPVYVSMNVAKTIFLKAAPEIDLVNHLAWSDYENWVGGVRSYKIFRGFQGAFSDLPVNTVPFGERAYQDDISDRFSRDGEYCYYVQGYQGLDTLFFFADSSRSNKVCIKQEKTFYIPSAFNPEGVNKIFKPYNTFLNPRNYVFQIYNRFGERIFETNEPESGWDGNTNGRASKMDVYVYFIKYLDEDFQTKEYRGTFTLLR